MGNNEKKKTKKHPEQHANLAKNKLCLLRGKQMSTFLLTILGIAVAIFWGIAINHYTAGDYENLRRGFWWLIPALISTSAIMLLAYWSYIVEPAREGLRQSDSEKNPTPNIVFGDSRLREPLAVGRKPWVDIVINNTSDVPAEGRFSDTTWIVQPPTVPNQLEYAYQGLGLDFDLAAHQIRSIHFDITYPFTKAEIDALNDGRLLLYIYAKGQYWAENDSSNRRPLPFCLLYNNDVPGKLVICPKSITISEGKPGNITHPNKDSTNEQ
ncbi:MAG: hypothetical protein ACRD6X_04220 [Pyrinomonadaceae bacterium]